MSKSKKDQAFIDSFGVNLRRLRKSKGLTMQDLAHACDMDYSQISRIELGKINTKITTVNILAENLGVEVKVLFEFGEGTK